MEAEEVLDRARRSLSAKVVFGEPIQQGELLVIPAAKVAGGGGGGGGAGPDDARGSGTGFGLRAVPAGVFLIKGGRVRWRPAVNANAAILGAQLLAGVSMLFLLRQRLRGAPSKRELRRGRLAEPLR